MDETQTVVAGGGPGAAYVNRAWILLILAILCLLGLLFLGLLVWTWPNCDLGICPAPAKTKAQTPAAAMPPSTGLEVSDVSPSSGEIEGNTLVFISGSGFANPATVKFDENAATEVKVVSPSLIRAKTPAHADGVVDVSVASDAKSASFRRGFTYQSSSSQRCILILVLLAGALGGTLHSIRSIVWYVGNRDLRRSWVPMYFFRPLTGAALACIFFLAFVSGVWTPQSGSGRLWIVGVAALVGLFSAQGYEKLKKVFEALLTAVPPAADAPKTVPTTGAPALDPASGPAGTLVKITGSGFTAATTVLFGTVAATSIRVDNPTTLFAVAPAQPPGQAAGPVDVTVTSPGNPPGVQTHRYTYT
jgi:hypothetical protein